MSINNRNLKDDITAKKSEDCEAFMSGCIGKSVWVDNNQGSVLNSQELSLLAQIQQGFISLYNLDENYINKYDTCYDRFSPTKQDDQKLKIVLID